MKPKYLVGYKGDNTERCPNCINPNPEIDNMPDGSCGVCGGKGFITWYDTGYRLVPVEEKKVKEYV